MILKRFAPACPFLLGMMCMLGLALAPRICAAEQLPSVDSPMASDRNASDPTAFTGDIETSAVISEQPSSEMALPAPDSASAANSVSKRLFGVIPNYRADQKLDTYTPLTTPEKFRIARSDSFDWPNYFLLAGFALESQVATGGFSHNGGFTGFGEFYARSLADQVIGSYVTEAMLPSLLHEDPRFFRLGVGTFRHRVFYAASRIFVTRMDSGRMRFNVSEIAGNAGFVALATLYYPDSRSAAEAGERYAMQLGNDAISNLLTEFWPDIRHRLRFPRRHVVFFP